MSGYSKQKVKTDLYNYFAMVNGIQGIHLCGNPEWNFFFKLAMDILSLNTLLEGFTPILLQQSP
jgi:hypothetical protein